MQVTWKSTSSPAPKAFHPCLGHGQEHGPLNLFTSCPDMAGLSLMTPDLSKTFKIHAKGPSMA